MIARKLIVLPNVTVQKCDYTLNIISINGSTRAFLNSELVANEIKKGKIEPILILGLLEWLASDRQTASYKVINTIEVITIPWYYKLPRIRLDYR